MAKNGMDALGTLLGLGLLGTLAEDSSKEDIPQFIKDMQHQQSASGKTSVYPQKPKPSPAEGAKAARELYDAYVQAGFTDEQAFELLKSVLTVGVRK